MIAVIIPLIGLGMFALAVVFGKVLKKRRLELEAHQKLLETMAEIERIRQKYEEEE